MGVCFSILDAQEEPVKLSEHLDETSNANNDNNDHRNTNSPSHNISLSSLLNNDEPQQPDANHSPIRHLSPVRVFDDVNDDDFLNLSPVKQQNQPTTPVPPLCDLPDTLSQLLRRPKCVCYFIFVFNIWGVIDLHQYRYCNAVIVSIYYVLECFRHVSFICILLCTFVFRNPKRRCYTTHAQCVTSEVYITVNC